MTTEEFSNEFDTLVDAYSMTLPFGLSLDPPQFNEYEKSVFLTKALEELVLAYYSTSIGGDSFETTEELRRYLDQLVITDTPLQIDTINSLSDSFKHTIYHLPDNIWFIIYEQAAYREGDKCIKDFVAEVLPVTHDAFYRIKGNPFRGPSRKRILRLDSGLNTVELVSKYPIGSYLIRYLKRPSPIILVNLTDLQINGESEKQTCALNTAVHRKILERGVQLALSSRVQPRTEKQQTK